MSDVSGGNGGSFGFGWITIYQADASEGENTSSESEAEKEIRLTKVEQCAEYYTLPKGKEFQATCKVDIKVDGYHVYNPKWNN